MTCLLLPKSLPDSNTGCKGTYSQKGGPGKGKIGGEKWRKRCITGNFFQNTTHHGEYPTDNRNHDGRSSLHGALLPLMANGSHREIFPLTENLFILCQCKLTRSGEQRIRLPLHVYLIGEKILAGMHYEGYREN